MKHFKKLLAIFVLGAVAATLAGCNSNSTDATAKTQTATVTRGNLTLEITAAGNLALSTVQDLTFALFYAKGTVGEVKVAAGDTVTKGESIASLDPAEWNNQIQVLEDALTAAQRDVSTKQRALATAQRAVTTKEKAVVTAQRLVTAKELAVQQAQIDVQSANNTLNKITVIKNIQDRIDNLNFVIKYAALGAEGTFGDTINWAYWTTILAQAKIELIQAQQDMRDVLNGTSSLTTVDVAIQVAQSQLQIELKQLALEDAQIALVDANTAINNAQQDFTFAQQDVTNAQSDLNISNQKAANAQESLSKAQASSPEIVAPFDGFITKVNVAGGDEVLSGAVVAQIADPKKFEADILVSEMDIPNVKLGSEATITADAISGIAMTANVTRIAPTATIQSGVVNYSVKVEVQSIRPVLLSQSANLSASTNNTTAQLQSRLQAAVDAGRITQQQADDFLKNGLPQDFASGNFTPPGGFGSSGTSGRQGTRQITTSNNTNFQLRQGMTVTVNIIIASRTNVLLVPNGAISTDGTQSYVQVISASGALEKRAVKTGLSNWQYTEITDGLKEGEQVSVTLNTATSTSTSRQGNMMFLGGRP